MKPVRIAVFMKDRAFGRAVARGLAGSGNNFILEVLETEPEAHGEKTWEVLVTDCMQMLEESGALPGLVPADEDDCRISALCRAVWAEADRMREKDGGNRACGYRAGSAGVPRKNGRRPECTETGQKTEIIGFSGCGGGSGATAVAVTAGRMLAGAYGERVLYLPLTWDNGAWIYREKEEGSHEGLRSGKEVLYRMMHGMPCSAEACMHTDCYGMEQIEGISALLPQERAALLEFLAEKGDYDWIIADLGNCSTENDAQKNVRKMCSCLVEVASRVDCRYAGGSVTAASADLTERRILVWNHGRENRAADGREPVVEIAHDEESFFRDAEDGRVEISMSKNFAIGVKNLTEFLLI